MAAQRKAELRSHDRELMVKGQWTSTKVLENYVHKNDEMHQGVRNVGPNEPKSERLSE